MTTTTVPQTDTDRTAEILAAVDAMIQEYDRWANDGRESPSGGFDVAVLECADVCATEPIPSEPELGKLVLQVVTFAEAYDRYLRAKSGFVVPGTVSPTSKVWNEFQEVIYLRGQINQPKTAANDDTAARVDDTSETNPDVGFFDRLDEAELRQDQLAELVKAEHQRERSLKPSEIAARLSEQTGQRIDGRAVSGIVAKAKREDSTV